MMMKQTFTHPDPEAKLEKIKEYREQELTQFYANAARLVWLIGNTTPVQRGSGTVAELTLKAIFDFHGLQAPILKSAFPQLDVLDTSFPSDDYIKLFTCFFEPSSLAEHLRRPSLSHLSTAEQLEIFYKEITAPALTQEEAQAISASSPEFKSPSPW